MRTGLFLLAFGLGQVSCTHSPSTPEPATSEADRSPSAKTWTLGGYFPEFPGQKKYVSFLGNQIANVGDRKPSGPIIETEGWIFPGLIDLHNHLKYNVLPLWSETRGQFTNRYEWRSNYVPYKAAVAGNMSAYESGLCQTIEWAELKALLGGTTTIQGIGGKKEQVCAQAKLTRNIEIAGDIDPQVEVLSVLDLIYPETVENAYLPYFSEALSKFAAKYPDWSKKKDELFEKEYAILFEQFLARSGLTDWLQTLLTAEKRDLGTAAILLFGSAQGFEGPLTDANVKKHLGQLDKILENRLERVASARKVELKKSYLRDFSNWILDFSKINLLKVKTVRDALENYGVGELLNSRAVLRLKPGVGKFATRFESTRRELVERTTATALRERKSFGVVVHLAEGRSDDEYNRLEFQMAHALNLVRPGMIFIHGVGIQGKEFEIIAKSGAGIVWSPFSNLLLYTETTDVLRAASAGVPLALGSDWSPTGSRNLLGELKVAKEYLKSIKNSKYFGPGKEFNDEKLVAMVTTRPAKMLNLEGVLGVVQKGALGDVIVVERRSSNPWQDLVDASEAQIQLVILGGFPVVGNPDLMQTVESATAIPMTPSAQCRFAKSFAWNPGAYSKGPETPVPEPSELIEKLQKMQGAFARAAGRNTAVVGLDPLFTCEDPQYETRVKNFIPSLVSQSNSRVKTRALETKAKKFRNPQWKATSAPAFGEE